MGGLLYWERLKPKPAETSVEKVRRLPEETDSLTAEDLLELQRQKAERQRKRLLRSRARLSKALEKIPPTGIEPVTYGLGNRRSIH